MKRALVRYISPFGSPAWMTADEAEQHLAEDDRLWAILREAGMALGAPARIEAR